MEDAGRRESQRDGSVRKAWLAIAGLEGGGRGRRQLEEPGKKLSPRASRKNAASKCLDFSPVRPMLGF